MQTADPAEIARLRDEGAEFADWLRRQIAKIPPARRAMLEAAMKPEPPDPCPWPRRCDEAQTCTGGCHDR